MGATTSAGPGYTCFFNVAMRVGRGINSGWP